MYYRKKRFWIGRRQTSMGAGMRCEIRPGRNRRKELLVRVVFFLFGRAAQFLSKIDPEIRREVSRWPQPFTILYRILPNGPRMALARHPAGHLEYLGREDGVEKADLTIAIKNLESAFLVFTFRLGMNQAYAQNRLSVRGDVPTAMSQMRVLNRVLAYMLPRRVVRQITLRMPEIRPLRRHLTCGVLYLFGIPFGGLTTPARRTSDAS